MSTGLRGLQGLRGLSQSEQVDYINKQKILGKLNNNSSFEQADRLYRNQNYIKKFGLSDFQSKNYLERDAKWQEALMAETTTKINDRYNPFTQRNLYNEFNVVTSANPIQDMLKLQEDIRINPNTLKPGMTEADVDAWEKIKAIQAVDPEGLVELESQGYKTSSELMDAIRKKEEIISSGATGFTLNSILGPALLSIEKSGTLNKILTGREEEDNSKILNNVFQKSVNKITSEGGILNEDILNVGDQLLRENDDASIHKSFLDNFPTFAAYYDKNGENPDDEVKGLSTQDKAIFLATLNVLKDKIGENNAREYLNGKADSYIKDNQGTIYRWGLQQKEDFIKFLSYTASKWPLAMSDIARPVVDTFMGETAVPVYIDNKGNIYGKDKVNTDLDGNTYFTNYKGESIPVGLNYISGAVAARNGIDADGTTKAFFRNAKVMEDAQRFNILPWNSKALERANDLGTSSSLVRYAPGEGPGWGRQIEGMKSFLISDLGETYLTMGAAAGFRGIMSAAGIAGQYAQGVYEENVQKNLLDLDNKLFGDAQKKAVPMFADKYEQDSKFHKDVDDYVKARTQQILYEKHGNAQFNREGVATTSFSKEEIEEAKAIARQEAMDNGIAMIAQELFNAEKNSDSYKYKVADAHEIAAHSAGVSEVTEFVKYGLVNTLTPMKVLYKGKAALANDAAARATKGITESGKTLVMRGKDWTKNLLEGGQKRKEMLSLLGGKAKVLGKTSAKLGWSGGWTNWTDEWQSGGARQVNEDSFMSYLNGDYDNDGEYGALDEINSFISGMSNAVLKQQSIDAFVAGAGGMAIPLPFGIHKIATRKGRMKLAKAYLEGGESAVLGQLFQSGLINDYHAAKMGEKQVRQIVDAVNVANEGKANIKNLQKALALGVAKSSVQSKEDADILNLLDAIRTIFTVKDYNSITDEENVDRAIVKMIAEKSSEMQKTLELADRISEGNITEEEAAEFLKDWYANNPSIPKSEENNQKGIAQIIENAKTLKTAKETWEKVDAQLAEVEKERGKDIDSSVRDKLIERAAVYEYQQKTTDERERKINGGTIKSLEDTSPTESYGTKEAIEQYLEATKSEVDEAKKKLKESKSNLESKQKEYDELVNPTTKKKGIFSRFRKTKPLTVEDMLAAAELEAEIEEAKLSVQYYEQLLDKQHSLRKSLSSRKGKLTKMEKDGETPRVLSKDEILSLNPEARARMLDKANLPNYSKEQQAVIEELRRELNLKDPTILSEIQTQAKAVRQMRANRNAYTMMLENPEAARVQLETENTAKLGQFIAQNNLRNAVNLGRWISNAKQDPRLTEFDVESKLIEVFKTYNPKYLEYLSNLDTADERFAPMAEYKDLIEGLKGWTELAQTAKKSADQMAFTNDLEKANFLRSIDNIIGNTKTKEEAQKALEEAINSEEVNGSDRNKLQQLLKNIGISVQLKEATTTETPAQKSERREQQQQQAKKQEEKVKAAEEKGKVEAEENKQKAKEPSDASVEESVNQDDWVELPEPNENKSEGTIEQNPTEESNVPQELQKIADQQGVSIDNLEELPAQSLEEQAAQANKGGETVAEVSDVKPDLTDSGNKIEATPENLLGNTMYGYDLDALIYERVEQERTGKDSSDSMSQYFNWLKNAGVKLQEIIDNELKDIVKANPELKIVYINPQKNATNDAALGNYAMLAVKYTDAVDKVHKKERGGVIDTNDGKYLLVGTLGSNPRNKAQSTYFDNFLNAGKAKRDSFFAANTSERFFVDPTMYTEVEKIAAGRLVGQSIGESEVTVKRISELLADRVRNPRNLKLQDLKWVIQYATKLATVNVTSRNKVHPPKDAPSNLGNTFLLIEGANGEYVPAYIIPTFLSEIADGKLKTEINSLVDRLASPDHGERLMALYGLFHWLNLGTDKNILIGTADNPIVSFKEDNITTRTFNLADPTFNIENLRAAMMELNPRINLTIANLMDKVNLEMLDEAGALTLDLSRLTTSNASYSVYAIGTDGKPIKTTPVTTNQSTDINVNSDLATSSNKVENSQLFAGQVYRRRGTGWVDRAGKPITDVRLLEQLELTNYLEKNQVGTALKEGNNEYYIINSDPGNPEVWSKNSKSSFVNKLSKDASRSILDRVRATELQKEREATAESINNSQEVIPDNVALSESMDEGIYVLTEEDLISQTIGEPVQETSSVPTESAPETSADAVVDNTNGATAAYSGKTLAEMQQSTHLTTAEELINSEEFGDRVLDILDEKGFIGETTDDVNKFLEEKNMPITGITDAEAWLQMLKDCR